MSTVAGIVGGIGAIGNLVGGGGSTSGNTSGSTAPVGYVPTGQAGADTRYQDIFSRLYGAGSGEAGALLPQYRDISAQMVNNPYAQGQQTAANNASGYALNTLVPQMQQGGQSLYDAGSAGLPFATQILNTGFDPQNALYDRTAMRLQDQLGVNAARSGVTGPQGAGIANQAMQNFNIDWQNNQLSRQNQAAQGYGNIINASGSSIGGGTALGGNAVTLQSQAGAIPYTTYNNNLNNNLGTLQNLTQFSNSQYQLPTAAANLLQSYMGLGQTANNNATNAANSQFNQNQAIGNQLGGAIGSLGNIFGPASAWFGGGTQTPAASPNPASGYYTDDNSLWGF